MPGGCTTFGRALLHRDAIRGGGQPTLGDVQARASHVDFTALDATKEGKNPKKLRLRPKRDSFTQGSRISSERISETDRPMERSFKPQEVFGYSGRFKDNRED